jgi:oxygen-dependent protoporphyrinogen oxidase
MAKRIAVVGGGISGLSAAWEAARAGARVTLLERDPRWGGKVQTERLRLPGASGEAIIDMGPESFITRKDAAWNLAQELGMGPRVRAQASETRNIYVLHQGKPGEVPMAPVKFLRSDLLSWRGKLRLAAEPLAPARRDFGDESLADFASRRLGREALEKFLGPILGGIYNSDPETQSVLTTSPVMREMEREHGGLLVATLARARLKAARRKEAAARGEPLPPPFATFAGGTQEMIDELVAQLEALPSVTLRSGVEVVEVAQGAAGWQISLAGGETLEAEAVIIATPANVAARLLQESAPEAAERLSTIRHASIGTITLAYRSNELQIGFPISGLMIPRREQRAIDAVTFTSERFPERTPAGYTLLRVFFGGSAPHMLHLDDRALEAAVRGELRALLGIAVAPVSSVVARWPQSYPQADVGHLDRVAEIEERLPAGVYVTGSAYRGLGVPDCVAQGRESARLALREAAPVPTGARSPQPVPA